MSKTLLAPLAIVAALVLAACGGDAPPADSTTAPPADAAPATTEPVTPPPA
ncbi:hypothetical protein [Devosia psychrophila]|uniref:hypothetical protein n=1 Tax=Devosia psychrophila TaxID=728005 RepID=UPI000AD05649|nr:hypothetical protein [Devosia psychrophila]